MRIQNLFVDHVPMDKNKGYLATFVTVQGVPRKYGSNPRDLDIQAIDALKQYIY